MNSSRVLIETTEPKARVQLGVGEHTLTLVVVDDAGMMSAPDTVVVKVAHVGLPHISHVDPARVRRNDLADTIVPVLIVGAYLQDATAVRIYTSSGQPDPQIRTRLRPGATPERLPIELAIPRTAELGERLLEVVTPKGIATARFLVISDEKPRLMNITPTWAAPGRRPVDVHIEGRHVEGARDLAFQWQGVADRWVTAQSTTNQPQSLIDARVKVSADAAFGTRTFAVKVDGVDVESPPGVTFSVLPGLVQFGVILLALATAIIHLALAFPTWLFILNGAGYLLLLMALYWPALWASRARRFVRWGLLAYALVTIVAWFAMGDRTTLAYVTKGIEVLLAALLVVEWRQA